MYPQKLMSGRASTAPISPCSTKSLNTASFMLISLTASWNKALIDFASLLPDTAALVRPTHVENAVTTRYESRKAGPNTRISLETLPPAPLTSASPPFRADALLSKPRVHRFDITIQSPSGRDDRLNRGPHAPKFFLESSSDSDCFIFAYSSGDRPDGVYGAELASDQED